MKRHNHRGHREGTVNTEMFNICDLSAFPVFSVVKFFDEANR